MALQINQRRFTVDDFYRMAESGVLCQDERVELIDGQIVTMNPIGSRHAACVKRLAALFAGCASRAIVSVQDPIHLDAHNQPQPDLALLRSSPNFYATAHPTAADVLLVVEIADTSLTYDRQVKLPLYAQHGIPEAWLVDTEDRRLTIYRDPSPTGYGTTRAVRHGEAITPPGFPDLPLTLAAIFG